jgi:hypothetical protein
MDSSGKGRVALQRLVRGLGHMNLLTRSLPQLSRADRVPKPKLSFVGADEASRCGLAWAVMST